MENEKLIALSEVKKKLAAIRQYFSGPPITEQDKLARAVVKMCLDEVKKIKPVDAVEVVRCKDCKHGVIDAGTNRLMCARCGEIRPNGHVWGGTSTLPENFCSYGERRTDV